MSRPGCGVAARCDGLVAATLVGYAQLVNVHDPPGRVRWLVFRPGPLVDTDDHVVAVHPVAVVVVPPALSEEPVNRSAVFPHVQRAVASGGPLDVNDPVDPTTGFVWSDRGVGEVPVAR